MITSAPIKEKQMVKRRRLGGYTDFSWLKQQALDSQTLQYVEQIERDEHAFATKGIVTHGDEAMILNLKQGTFHTKRVTAHSLASIFVHIFKNKEHMLLPGFDVIDRPVIVDIGANEGYYSLKMAQNPGAKVFAIEPNPAAFELLCKNIQANDFENIVPLECAIWKEGGKATLNVIPQVTSIGTLLPIESSFMSEAEDRVRRVSVNTMTLDELIANNRIDRIDLLKIDVEGGELELLQASLSSLVIVDRIVIEYHNQEIRHRLTNLLRGEGFTLELHQPDRPDFGDLYFTKAHLLV